MATENDLLRIILVIVAVVLFVPFLMMVFVIPFMGMWGGGHMWNGTMWDAMWNGSDVSWLWLLMWLVMLGIVVAVGSLLYKALRRPDRQDPALEELRTAYARGDLSDEEFENRRERLEREE